ncbi:KRAB-A domain-containing protein 2-like [Pseudophryne corroboree]|uniref:KRAB-A domain-containing protein 2-like n=1 Tax=Pseudophryne corroboree TaxID=495146 RepID=UPI003081E1C3
MSVVDKQLFYDCFQSLLSEKREDNSMYLTTEKYSEIIEQVKIAKLEKKKSSLSYRRLKRFQICCVGDKEKLIAPLSETSTSVQYYITNEDMYDVLHEAHVNTGHGGKHRMLAELKKSYKNVTQEVVLLFLKLCLTCQQKLSSQKKAIVVKPVKFSELESRCQVDLIDMQSQSDNPFQFILVYQDYVTKFVQLRPLTSKEPSEVAKQLLDIFCIFGAPSIIQSESGREFANGLISELKALWPNLKVVHGKLPDGQNPSSVETTHQDIQNMLLAWMDMEKSPKWSEGLRFVQIMKNTDYHESIYQSPYQAMFGRSIKIGLSTSPLPSDAVEELETEEELEELLHTVKNRRFEIQRRENANLASDPPENEIITFDLAPDENSNDRKLTKDELIS